MFKLIHALKYLGVYFKYKNKVLWEGQLVNNQTITVNDIELYNSIALVLSDHHENKFVCYVNRHGHCVGGGIVTPWSTGGIGNAHAMLKKVGENTYQLDNDYSGYALDRYSSNHTERIGFSVSGTYIKEIIGLEPNISKITEFSYGGGGGTKFTSIFASGRWAIC